LTCSGSLERCQSDAEIGSNPAGTSGNSRS